MVTTAYPAHESLTLPDEYFQERLGVGADELQESQDEGLPKACRHACERSPLYRRKFGAAGLSSDSIRGLQDLRRLPFTTIDEIRPDPARGYTASQIMSVDHREITVIHRSSGTTGSPKVFPYTPRDLVQWASNVATVSWMTGSRKGDVMISAGRSREFTGFGGGYLGAVALGITYIPITVGPGVTQTIVAHLTGHMHVDGREVRLDPILHANVMKCMPSFLPRLIEALDEHGVTNDQLLLTKLGCGSEPSSDSLRLMVYKRLGIWPRDDYGLGELYGPGVAGECDARNCLHVLSDTYIAEVIDPETGEPTPEGEIGELVLTSLHKDALPMLRYRTGDRVMAMSQDCPCGMAHLRIGRVTGRISADDIVIPGGMVVNRAYLEEVVLAIDGASCEYAVTVAEDPLRVGLKRLYIAIEGDGDPAIDDAVIGRFRQEYNYTPVVHVLPQGAIPRVWGKAKRVFTPDEYEGLVRPLLAVEEG
jgi:phenylacetate-CoA ligase